MSDRQTATWKIILGYAAFAIAAFLFFFYLTFPFDSVRSRIETEASATGYAVDIGHLGPGLFGVTASNVNVRKKPAPGAAADAKPGEALHIESVALRPSLFPLGLAFRANALGGTVSGAVGGLKDLAVHLSLDGVDLSKGNIKGFSGMDLAGKLNGNVDLVVPKTSLGGGKAPAEPDFGAANGSIVLTGSSVTVNGGEIEVPSMGGAMGLPKIIFGDLDAKLNIEKGQGKLDALKATSTDLTLMGSGTVKLAKRLEYSESNLEFKFKVEDDLKKRLGPLSMGLTMLKADPKDPTFRVAHMTGFFGRPNFR